MTICSGGIEAYPSPDQIVFDDRKQPVPVEVAVPYLQTDKVFRVILQKRWRSMLESHINTCDSDESPAMYLEAGRLIQLQIYFTEVEWPELYEIERLIFLSLISDESKHLN